MKQPNGETFTVYIYGSFQLLSLYESQAGRQLRTNGITQMFGILYIIRKKLGQGKKKFNFYILPLMKKFLLWHKCQRFQNSSHIHTYTYITKKI